MSLAPGGDWTEPKLWGNKKSAKAPQNCFFGLLIQDFRHQEALQ
jgi:hypothetical protein